MKRKKEIIIIISIIIVIIILILIPVITNSKKNTKIVDDTNTIITSTNEEEITLLIKGEINYRKPNSISDDDIIDEMYITTYKGITYGELLPIIMQYHTKYTKYNNDLTISYNHNQTIIIESYFEYEIIDDKEEVDINNDKIDFNNASLIELKSLYGIGDKRAEMLIDYFNEGNKFESFLDLKSFLGVSDEVITRIEEEAFLQ